MSVHPAYTFTFSTSLKPLNEIQRNLTGSKISTSSTKFVFIGPIGKPLIGCDILTSPLKPVNGIKRNFTGSPSGPSEKQDGRSCLWLAETFSNSADFCFLRHRAPFTSQFPVSKQFSLSLIVVKISDLYIRKEVYRNVAYITLWLLKHKKNRKAQ